MGTTLSYYGGRFSYGKANNPRRGLFRRIRNEDIPGMHPVLFHAFGFPVPAYGFLLALSFLIGTGLAAWVARGEGSSPEAILDVVIWIIIGAFIGARVYYVVLHPDRFQPDLLRAFIPFVETGEGFGGLVLFGGILGGIVSAFLYLKFRRLPVGRYLDTIAPSIALGVALTRVGCFLNGCCHGTGWDGPLAASFPLDSPAGRFQGEIHAVGLHPSQLYESFGGLVILVFLVTVGRRWKRWDGLRFSLVALLYAVLRFVVDFTRHYGPEERLGALSHNQVVSLVFFVVFSILALRIYRSGPAVS
jgi:phosphatidylglycerol:prolipoprotein diacylglycerol transferase